MSGIRLPGSAHLSFCFRYTSNGTSLPVRAVETDFALSTTSCRETQEYDLVSAPILSGDLRFITVNRANHAAPCAMPDRMHLSCVRFGIGADGWDRTSGPQINSLLLYLLSYIRMWRRRRGSNPRSGFPPYLFSKQTP